MKLFLAVDIGAGSGAKLALIKYDHEFICLKEKLLKRSLFPDDYPGFIECLKENLENLLKEEGLSYKQIFGAVISSAGLIDQAGVLYTSNNLPFLAGHQLARDLEERSNFPWTLINDGKAGALAECYQAKQELLLWILGGGWGGAWVKGNGILYEAEYKDFEPHFCLDPILEPGYATALCLEELRPFFTSYGIKEQSIIDFLKLDAKEYIPGTFVYQSEGKEKTSSECFHAEKIISGPGRHHLFELFSSYFPSPKNNPEIEAVLHDPGTSGKLISDLSRSGDQAAFLCDTVFGEILGYCASKIIPWALQKGLSREAPIFLGGKPSLAWPGFLPSLMKQFTRYELTNPVYPSYYLDKTINQNMLGGILCFYGKFL